nr:alpha/beta hydrolase [Methylobacterium sp. Leaf118]
MTKRSAAKAGRRQAAQVRKSVKAATKTVKAATKAAQGAMRQAESATQALVRAAAPAPKATQRAQAGRFVTVDGLRVHVIVRGRGRPVVLIHGNGTMAEDFAICGLIDRLAARYRVIAIDRPGFGRTQRPRHRVWTASAQAALMHRVLDGLKAERPLIVAHSWGTLVALAMAAEPRHALRGLVLLSGYYFPEARADVSLAKPLALPGVGDAARALVPNAVNRAMAEQSFRRVFRPQPVPARFVSRFPIEIAAGATQLRAATEDAATMNTAAGLLQRHYPRLTLPVAILSGDADAMVDAASQSTRLHGTLPESSLKILPGLGHMIHYGARTKIERAVDAVMNTAAGRPPAP